jgi:hypothetical protein|tara:strand:+ start:361 stop:585 length:225 start_codon:yes stop_codon:yes gene_type:complete
VIGQDPEFYLKVVALNQITTNKLKVVVAGDNVTFYLGDERVGDMNSGLFFKLTPKEILKTIGVSNEHRKGWLLS